MLVWSKFSILISQKNRQILRFSLTKKKVILLIIIMTCEDASFRKDKKGD